MFVLRFETGDVYPPYSSLRPDPLGVKAFFQGLEALPGLEVERNHGDAARIAGGPRTTVFVLGADAGALAAAGRRRVEALERIVAGGARLVLALRPDPHAADRPDPAEGCDAGDRADGGSAGAGGYRDSGVSGDSAGAFEDLRRRWGFDVQTHRDSPDIAAPSHAILRDGDPALPFSVAWRGGLVLAGADPAWRTVYTVGDATVLAERRFGDGTIVLSTDSFFASNEAIWRERHPDLLTWLVGDGTRIVFDETHLGVAEHVGLSDLVRKYRLQWLFGSLALLALMFIWKGSASLIPRREDDVSGAPDVTEGAGLTLGLARLLRRSIPGREVIPACVGAWRESLGPGEEAKAARVRDAVDGAPGGAESDPVRSYREIHRIINERK